MQRYNIVVVDWCWEGHHPTYFKNFVQNLLRLNCRVLALCPAPDEVVQSVISSGIPVDNNLEIQELFWWQAAKILSSRIKLQVSSVYNIHAVAKRCRAWEHKKSVSVDLVFFACMYDHQFYYFPKWKCFFPYKWSGLYLQCQSVRLPGTKLTGSKIVPNPKRMFFRTGCRSLGVLDEGAGESLEKQIDLPVIAFPDVADTTSSEMTTPLVQKLLRTANGRPIVCCLGELYKSKGIITLAQLAMDDQLSDLCFAFVGKVHWGDYTQNETTLLNQLDRLRENTFVHFSRVPDGVEFNALLNASDVIYAAYWTFPHSSNILTKAAFFKKPVIVSDGFLMAERVRRFCLGAVVPEKDPEATANAIRRLVSERGNLTGKPFGLQEDYARRHGVEELRSALRKIIACSQDS